MIVSAKNPYQGYSVGILLFDGIEYPMPPGDVGNATTYPFPVLLRVVEGLFDNPFPPLTLPDGTYTEPVRKCIDAAVQMEKDGARAIAMCCGFFSLIQPVVAAHVDIPVMTSPLMMIPIIQQLMKPDKSIVVVTADGKLLTSNFFTTVKADLDDRIVVAGLENAKTVRSVYMFGPEISFETDDLRDEVVEAVQLAMQKDANVGAVLLECTSLPPYAHDVRQATRLPVNDFISSVEWMHRAVTPKQYSGYI